MASIRKESESKKVLDCQKYIYCSLKMLQLFSRQPSPLATALNWSAASGMLLLLGWHGSVTVHQSSAQSQMRSRYFN